MIAKRKYMALFFLLLTLLFSILIINLNVHADENVNYDNLIANGNFEDNDNNWGPPSWNTSNAKTEITDEFRKDGERSLKIWVNAGAWVEHRPNFDYNVLNNGVTYIVRCDVLTLTENSSIKISPMFTGETGVAGKWAYVLSTDAEANIYVNHIANIWQTVEMKFYIKYNAETKTVVYSVNDGTEKTVDGITKVTGYDLRFISNGMNCEFAVDNIAMYQLYDKEIEVEAFDCQNNSLTDCTIEFYDSFGKSIVGKPISGKYCFTDIYGDVTVNIKQDNEIIGSGRFDYYTDSLSITAFHEAVKVDAKEPTTTEIGNQEYYYCSSCNKYFDDAECENEIMDKKLLEKYLITYVLDEGENGKNPSTYTYGTFITLEHASKKGYNFIGWFTTETFEPDSQVFEIYRTDEGNKVLYAKFEKIAKEYTIILKHNVTGINATILLVKEGEIVNIPEYTLENYKFDAVYSDEKCTKLYDKETIVTDNMILYINWISLADESQPSDEGAGCNSSINTFNFTYALLFILLPVLFIKKSKKV